jgi:glutathione peroxidase
MQTAKQKFLAKIYPFLMRFTKALGIKTKQLFNNQNAIAITPWPWQSIVLNNGQAINEQSIKNKFVLIVNTASNCGYTAQYAALQQLQDQYSQLSIIAFPANNFKNQEQANNAQIETFCTVNYGIKFAVAQKSNVVGQNIHPLFSWLSQANNNGWCSQAPSWNFCKYLINPQGQLVAYYDSGISPLHPNLIKFLN